MGVQVKIDEKAGKLIITADLAKTPAPSGSGKTLIVATTGGNQKTGLQYKGSEVVVGLNAYIPNPNFAKPQPVLA